MRKRRTIKTNPNFVKVFNGSAVRTGARNMHKMADEFAKMVRNVIYKQLYSWPPLTEKYRKRKEREGLDPRILIATKKYVRSIKAIRTVDKKNGVMYSTGPVGKMANGIPLTRLGRWLEFGTSKMPPREHWRPAWSIFLSKKDHTKKKLKDDIWREFNKDIKATNKAKTSRSQ